jgi:hypothetical protein
MSFVKYKNFVTKTPDGVLSRLQCKLCGTVIGEIQMRTVGFRERPNGRIVERIVENFTRNHLYSEIKIACEDGSAHVTNGCHKCLTGELSVEVLEELIQTDEEEQELSPSARKVTRVLKTLQGGGIL